MARLDFFDLPTAAVAEVERIAGDRVITATTPTGGFTLGPASVCTLSEGGTVFVKASHPSVSDAVTDMHRREAEVLAALPPTHPAPNLIGHFEVEGWFGLVTEAVDGIAPGGPLGDAPEIVDRVFELVATLAEAGATCPLDDASPIGSDQRERASRWAWKQLRDDGLAGALDTWSATHLDQLVALEADWIDAGTGDTLVHRDLRTDNMVLATDGATGDIAVDWATASRGAVWVDLVGLLPSLRMQGGADPETAFRAHPVGAAAEPDAVTCWLASIAGYFTRSALLPAPPGLARLRRFQHDQGVVARTWLNNRLGWSQG